MTTEQEALKLADALDAPYVLPTPQALKTKTAAMLRKLVAEREADRAAMREALEALEIGLDGARDAALEMRMKYGGYMNRLQQAADNDVRKIEAAITHLRQRLEGTT